MKIYHDLLEDVLQNGSLRPDRTGTGILSVFGRQIRHDLSLGFPLLTTKKIHFKSIVAELLWFLKGETNIASLNAQKVSIWDEWADSEGNLGPIYGYQWRFWPGPHGEPIDQISHLIAQIKQNPYSRRLLFHGWNVSYLPDESLSPQENVALGKMALPPCHLLYQFSVRDRKLSCLLYLRSNDLFLGHPYNLASVSLLTHMIAQQTDLDVGEVILSIGDLHLYANHIEQAKTQLQRESRPLPKLSFKRRPDSLFDFTIEDIVLEGYDPHPAISAPIAI